MDSLITHGGESLPAKLSRPRLQRVYPRRRVFDAISNIGDFGAVWITGPAGSGKTTAINSYLTDRNRPCIWYSLDEGDSDIASFFFYLRWAVKAYLPAEENLPPALTPDYFPNFSVYAKRFFERIFTALSSQLVLVFDDYQEVPADSALHEVLCSAISQIPRGNRLYVLSREEPPPELVRPRANCKLYLIGWEHLRLEPAETHGIAQEITRKTVSDTVIADLQAKTDGWVAGLILLLRRGEFEAIEPQLLSKHTPREIFDYFGGEIFDKLPPGVQKQMLQFAFLPRISANAAKTITGTEDAEDLLHRLHRGNIFLNRLVGEDIYYRFHPLLRDFLQLRARRTLDSEAFTNLLRRSAAILVEEGDTEEGIRLYVDAGEPEKATALILSQAPVLAGQGRFRTLESWISLLPESVVETSPWYLYWRATCRLPYAVKDGSDLPRIDQPRELFIQALSEFEQTEDRIGSYLALSGVLDTYWMEMSEFQAADRWIAKYDEFRSRWGPDYPPEVIPWLTPALLGALVMRRPNHPDLAEWIENGMKILRTVQEPAMAMRVFLPTVFLRLLQGDLLTAENLIHSFQWCASENASPWGALIFHSVNSLFCMLSGNFSKAVRIAETAHQLEKQCGIHIIYPHLNGAVGAVCMADMKTAERLLGRTAPFVAGYGHYPRSFYHAQAGWIALVKGDWARVKVHASEGIEAAEKAGSTLTLPINCLLCALVCHYDEEKEAAEKYVNRALHIAETHHARQLAFGCRLIRAEFATKTEESSQWKRHLANAFRLSRENNYVNTHFWRPEVMADLCVKALEHDIETDYARFLVRHRKLIPKIPPRHLENWPWPIKIQTFGGFSLEIDGEPFISQGKAQLRPLSILKYLVAAPGHTREDDRIQDDLWPDSDGDRAANAFKTALHRLRKLLGDGEAVLLNSGRLYLNEQKCWTDLQVFEDLVEEASSLTANPDSGPQAYELANRLLILYRGAFLPEEDTPWAIRTRQSAAGRFIRFIQDVADGMVRQGDTPAAIRILDRASAAEPLEESLPMFQMELFHRVGETAEAIRIFEQYSTRLSAHAGVSPSSRLTALHQTLKKS